MLSRECGNVVLLLLHIVRTFPSNWSAHHQTSSCIRDELHSHVDEKRVRERVQVSGSDLVCSDLPHPLIDVRQFGYLPQGGEGGRWACASRVGG